MYIDRKNIESDRQIALFGHYVCRVLQNLRASS